MSYAYLSSYFMVGPLEGSEVVGEGGERHEEHGHDALHGRRHGVRHRVVDALWRVRVVER